MRDRSYINTPADNPYDFMTETDSWTRWMWNLFTKRKGVHPFILLLGTVPPAELPIIDRSEWDRPELEALWGQIPESEATNDN